MATEEGKKDEIKADNDNDNDNNNMMGGMNFIASQTRIISFKSKGDWCKNAISECNNWFEHCKNNIAIQDISTIIKNSSNADRFYYFIYITYTIKSDNNNNSGLMNLSAYKTRIRLFYCGGKWGKKAENECNQWLEKCNEHIKVQKIWNIVRNSSNIDHMCYYYFVVYTLQ